MGEAMVEQVLRTDSESFFLCTLPLVAESRDATAMCDAIRIAHHPNR